MEGDPTGVAAAPAAADTAATADVAPAQSEPTAEATRAAEGQPGESASDSTTPPGDEPAEDSVETEGTDTESEDDRPRNDEERKLSRRERQRLREQERIDKAIADALAQKEREREQAEEARKRQEQADQAARERRQRYERFVGTPETIQSLASEVDQLNAQIRRELVTPTPGTDLDALIEQANSKTAELGRLRENQEYNGVIKSEIYETEIQPGFAVALGFPEMSDQKDRLAFWHAPNVAAAVTTLAQTIRSHKDAEWQAKVDAQARDFQAQLKAIEADRDGWRVRAGGGTVGVEEAGSPAYGSGELTPERYAAMDSSERAKLRSTSEGRAQIDAMTRRARGAA